MSTAFTTPATENKTTLGFWLYLMTDCVVFATLFAAHAVLRTNTNGGPSGSELFSMPYVLTETIVLLVSSLVCGLGLLAAYQRKQAHVFFWLGLTFILGATFLGLELAEFRSLAAEGNSWTQSAFLSSFFTLVGTHGLHIAVGLIWLVVLFTQIVKKGFTAPVIRRLTLFSMFWHFLDLIWIFIFTIVFLMGEL